MQDSNNGRSASGEGMTATDRCLRRRLGLVVALVGTVVLLCGPRPRQAGAATSFSAIAAAAGVRFTITAQNAPLTSTPVDVGGPVAQATLDSLGTSQAFASFPYPGDVVVNLAGTVAGLTGGKVHLPDYPFYVSSAYPLHPAASVSHGPYSLATSSQPDAAGASADAGFSGAVSVISLSTSASVTRGHDGSVTAHSLSTTSPLALGALHLGSVTSEATVVFRPDGSTKRESHLTISSITVGPVSIALTDKGLTILNSTTPVPSLAVLNALLAPQHINVAYVAARPIDGGVISAALQIVDTLTLPDVGASSVTYILGQDSATIRGAAFPVDATPTPSHGTPSSPTFPTAVSGAPTVAAPAASSAAAVPAQSRVALGTVLPVRRATAVAGAGFTVFRLYGVLVVAGLAALALGLLVGGKVVRLRWTT
jgi:hypothetical protein